jgi:hypothetical protein
VELGTRYGIVTPYTSYLATDGSENQALVRSQPSTVRPLRSAVTDSSGRGAVLASKDSKAKQETVSVGGDEDELSRETRLTVKRVGVKTFYLENGVWVDGEFKESANLPETKLKFMSSEYFDLISAEKDLAQYLSLGEEVVLVWKGRLYRVLK